jgi:hypothetical protein
MKSALPSCCRIQGISKADYDASLLNVNNIKADMDLIRPVFPKQRSALPLMENLV